MHCVLIGFKASGKTTVGRQLATSLGRDFLDTDEAICTVYGGGQAHEIYQTLGEPRFRALEHQIITSLKPTQNTVIATGGGVVLNPLNIAYLKTLGSIIFLNTRLEIIAHRLQVLNRPSPFLDLQSVYLQRQALYFRAADQVIDCEDESPMCIADKLYQTIRATNGE